MFFFPVLLTDMLAMLLIGRLTLAMSLIGMLTLMGRLPMLLTSSLIVVKPCWSTALSLHKMMMMMLVKVNKMMTIMAAMIT